MIMDLRTGLADNPITADAKKKMAKKRVGPTIENAAALPKPAPKPVAPSAPAASPSTPEIDLSKVKLGNTTEMATSFKEQFGRPPSQSELQSLVSLRNPATTEGGTIPFDPAQDIVDQATQPDVAEDVVEEPVDDFTVTDETYTSDALGDTDAVSRLESLASIEEKYFEDSTKLDNQIIDIDSKIKKYEQSVQAGLDLVADQAIPMGFITGQQASMERRANRQLQTLTDLKAIAVEQKKLQREGLQDRLAFAQAARLEEDFQMKKKEFEQNQILGRLELIAKVGGDISDADIAMADGLFGKGFSDRYMTTTKKIKEAKDFNDKVEQMSNIYNTLATVPPDVELDFGDGIKYSGLQSAGDQGIQTLTEWDERTGEKNLITVQVGPDGKPVVLGSVSLPNTYKDFSESTTSKNKYFTQPDAEGKVQYYFGNPASVDTATKLSPDEYRKGVSTAAGVFEGEVSDEEFKENVKGLVTDFNMTKDEVINQLTDNKPASLSVVDRTLVDEVFNEQTTDTNYNWVGNLLRGDFFAGQRPGEG